MKLREDLTGPMGEPGEFLSTFEAARRAGVARETVVQWCRDGSINCTQNGRQHWRVETRSLLGYLEKHGVDAGPSRDQSNALAGAPPTHTEQFALWKQRWDDRALRALGEWLAAADFTDDEATYVVAGVWSYYSYTVVPTVLDYPPMVLSAQRTERGADAWLHLPQNLPNRRLRADEVRNLKQSFVKKFRHPVAPRLLVHLDFIGSTATMANDVEVLCALTDRTFLGVYEDNLEAELAKVIRPDQIRAWLDAPHDAFGGKSPRQLIRDPKQDHLIRDLIMGVKYGAVA